MIYWLAALGAPSPGYMSEDSEANEPDHMSSSPRPPSYNAGKLI